VLRFLMPYLTAHDIQLTYFVLRTLARLAAISGTVRRAMADHLVMQHIVNTCCARNADSSLQALNILSICFANSPEFVRGMLDGGLAARFAKVFVPSRVRRLKVEKGRADVIVAGLKALELFCAEAQAAEEMTRNHIVEHLFADLDVLNNPSAVVEAIALCLAQLLKSSKSIRRYVSGHLDTLQVALKALDRCTDPFACRALAILLSQLANVGPDGEDALRKALTEERFAHIDQVRSKRDLEFGECTAELRSLRSSSSSRFSVRGR